MLIHAERLTSGRRNEFAIQERMIWYAETAPIGIKNMAEKRAGILVVDTTMTFPMTEMGMRIILWMLRSPVHPETYVTTRETKKAPIQTGEVTRGVQMEPYPSVLTVEGK